MRLVILESPYAAPDRAALIRNVRYARLAVAHSIHMGEAPIASHLLYPQPGILDESVPGERALGIALGLAWVPVAQAMVLYTDLGISRGMNEAANHAAHHGLKVEERKGLVDEEELAILRGRERVTMNLEAARVAYLGGEKAGAEWHRILNYLERLRLESRLSRRNRRWP